MKNERSKTMKAKKYMSLLLTLLLVIGMMAFPVSAAITQNEYGEDVVDTWEDLKELASHTYEKHTQVYFSSNAPKSIVIDADLTIPENLVVFAGSIRFVIPEGVTLTICKNAGFDAFWELEGSIKNAGHT